MEQLLVVQGHDTLATQLRTRRQGMPERAEAAEVAAAERALAARSAEVEAERHRLDRAQTKLEDDIASVRARAAQTNKALYGGGITNPRELQGLQDEVTSLTRRIAQLEDREIEVLVEREPVDEETNRLSAERSALAERAATLAAAITVAEAEIDAQLATIEAARAAAAEVVPGDLLTEYEALRAANGGVGIARLEHGTCGGCHLRLSAVEQDRIKNLPTDSRITCEDCGRLLVR